jgi:hypothetical protein
VIKLPSGHFLLDFSRTEFCSFDGSGPSNTSLSELGSATAAPQGRQVSKALGILAKSI